MMGPGVFCYLSGEREACPCTYKRPIESTTLQSLHFVTNTTDLYATVLRPELAKRVARLSRSLLAGLHGPIVISCIVLLVIVLVVESKGAYLSTSAPDNRVRL